MLFYLAVFLAAVVIALLIRKIISSSHLETGKTKQDSAIVEKNSDSGRKSELGGKLVLGAMGAKLLDDQIEKQKQEREKRHRESLYWQESIREKNHLEEKDKEQPSFLIFMILICHPFGGKYKEAFEKSY